MARKIIWSRRAQNDRFAIFDYWNKRNKSKTYSKKLNKLFIAAVEFVAIHPNTGKLTERKNVRIKFVSHFALLYKVKINQIDVLSVFDTRQNPEKIDDLIK